MKTHEFYSPETKQRVRIKAIKAGGQWLGYKAWYNPNTEDPKSKWISEMFYFTKPMDIKK